MAGQRNGSSYRWRRLRARVIAEENTCALCGKPVDKSLTTPDPGSPEVDHIMPVSKGGAMFDRGNVTLSHRACNRAKSAGDAVPAKHAKALSTSRKW